MTTSAATGAGAVSVPGVVNRRSRFPFAETVEHLLAAVDAAGASLFACIDQRAEAERADLALRPTTLLIFGNPAAGTKVMAAAPLSALDLPLKILVWEDEGGTAWTTCLSAQWLAQRYGLSADLAAPLAAPERLSDAVSRPDDAA